MRRQIFVALAFVFGTPVLLSAQAADNAVESEGMVTVVASTKYEAGELHEYLLGHEYRPLWTTPIRVPVLDLEAFAGGLEPLKEGGAVQTQALRFRGEDGREYNFRSVDKELTPSLPPDARNTVVDWLRQDATSAQHPAAPLIATALLDAVGILNPGPELVVLPDDPALGEFRDEFGGMLGTIEVHANEGEDNEPLFAGSPDIEATADMLEHIRESPEDRADSRAFLASRLMSLFMGDWDRHAGQFRWARDDRDGVHWWVPVPEDRDYAFVDYDGFLLDLAEMRLPRLVEFDEQYQDLMAMMANSLDLNRRLLSPLSRADWDSVATALQERLTDRVIEGAVRTQPAAYFEISGEAMIEKLKARRDQLPAVAERYYELMAQNVEIHATDEDDRAEIHRNADGSVEVRIAPEDDLDEPFYERTFDPDETEEIRIFLYGADDEAVIDGPGGGTILIRLIGGEGADELQDFTRGPTVIYDAEGQNEINGGRHTRIDPRPFQEEELEGGLLPSQRRDWGSKYSLLTPAVAWHYNVGLVVGGGPTWTQYDFRHDPYAWRMGLRGYYAVGENRFAVEYRGDFRLENSDQQATVLARASNMESTRFHGFGNQTADEDAEDQYLIWQRRLRFEPTWHYPLHPSASVAVGPVAVYTDPQVEPGSVAAELEPFGTEALGQIGARLGTEVDLRDDANYPRRGAFVEAGGAGYFLTGVEDTDAADAADESDLFARAFARASTYFTLPVLNEPTLALRAGGERVWGRFPVWEAAFVGGSGTVRGHDFQRYAGEAAVYGSAELRIPLAYIELITLGDLGVSLLADAGRVYVDGESPGGWHTATGAGVWFATLGQVFTLTYASGANDRLYLRIGMPF